MGLVSLARSLYPYVTEMATEMGETWCADRRTERLRWINLVRDDDHYTSNQTVKRGTTNPVRLVHTTTIPPHGAHPPPLSFS